MLDAKQIQSVLEQECGARSTVVDGSCEFSISNAVRDETNETA